MRFAWAIAAALSLPVTSTRAGNIDLGTVELSGTASILRVSSSYADETAISLNPGVAVYLAPFLNIGPLFSWSHFSYDYVGSARTNSSSSLLDIGGKVGFLVNWSDGFGRPLPFLDLGAGGEFVSQEYTSSNSDNGAIFTVTGGIKLKVGECFYLSVSESYNHRGVSSFDNQFLSGVGFSGLIGR